MVRTNKNTMTKSNGFKNLRCKCGSKRMEVEYTESEGEGIWVNVTCKRCGSTLYYNGA